MSNDSLQTIAISNFDQLITLTCNPSRNIFLSNVCRQLITSFVSWFDFRGIKLNFIGADSLPTRQAELNLALLTRIVWLAQCFHTLKIDFPNVAFKLPEIQIPFPEISFKANPRPPPMTKGSDLAHFSWQVVHGLSIFFYLFSFYGSKFEFSFLSWYSRVPFLHSKI